MRKKLIRTLPFKIRGDTKFRLQTRKWDTCVTDAGVDVLVTSTTSFITEGEGGIILSSPFASRDAPTHILLGYEGLCGIFLCHVNCNHGRRLSRFVLAHN